VLLPVFSRQIAQLIGKLKRNVIYLRPPDKWGRALAG
jgi:hypothetical protein